MLSSLVLLAFAVGSAQGQQPGQHASDSLCAAPASAVAPVRAVVRRPAAHHPLAAMAHAHAAAKRPAASTSAAAAPHHRAARKQLAARPKPAPRAALPRCRPAVMAAVASSAPGDPPTETGSIAADTALVLPAAASPVASPGASTAVAPDAAAPAAAATAPDAAVAGAGALPAEESALPPATAAASDSSHGSLLPFIPLLGVGMFLALTGGGNGSDLGLPPDVGGTPPAGSPPGGGPPPIITPPIVPPVTTTPEPATMVLIASGLGALGAARTRRRGK